MKNKTIINLIGITLFSCALVIFGISIFYTGYKFDDIVVTIMSAVVIGVSLVMMADHE